MSSAAAAAAGAAQVSAPSHSMLGMRLDYLEVEPFVRSFADRAERSGASAYACVPDVHQCMLCHESPEHRAIVNGADFVMSDSTIMQTARAWRHGVPRLGTELGTRLMLAICAEAQERGIAVALVGGRDDEALAEIVRQLRARFPALDVAYAWSPPFRPITPDDERAMLDGIAALGARITFFGIGCPKQEQWMARYKGRIGGAMIGVGAAFDAIGGTVRPAPRFVHRMGLEWLYRLSREPRRLGRRYFHSAPRFVWLLLRDRVAQDRSIARG